GRIFDHVEDDQGQYNDEREIFWASGACMAIRSKAFHLFNGFDEDYFAHMEEIDLCWKLHRNHQQVYYCGASTIYHVGAGTLAYGSSRKVFLNFRNGLFLIFKHLPVASLLYKLPIRLMLDWLAAAKFLLTGEVSNSLAVLRAHVAFVGNMSREIKKRKILLKAYPYFPGHLIRESSIVFSYYVMGKKTYDQ
ncbi:MAG TPA: hypothetical protein VK666_13510, partial [Chryseolinea sp.]|nr:hypothetical protein [Chryseolinea sp.]